MGIGRSEVLTNVTSGGSGEVFVSYGHGIV